jgi:hypothetical protein
LGEVDVPFFGVFLNMISTKYHGKKRKKKWSLSLVFMQGKTFGYGPYPTKHLLVH